MGKISILNQSQKIILEEISKNEFISKNFYFTGGTALSEFYLHHRFSDDLDFFCEEKFDNQPIILFFEELRKKYRFKIRIESIETVNSFYLKFPNKQEVKVDFNYHPFKRVKKSIFKNGLYIDSLLDIAINKLITLVQRTDIKDFVDFYFLEPKFGIWDLLEGAKNKFHQKIEPYILASDLLKIEDFDFLPRMIKPLTLSQLKKFFRKKAKILGIKAVEK